MPFITDGDVTKGFMRERKVLKAIIIRTIRTRSPALKKYIEGIARATGLPPEVVAESEPARRFLEKLIGL